MSEDSPSTLGRHEFEALARGLMPELYRYALWLSRDVSVAEEVVQESLLRAWRSRKSLREHGAAKSWLLTIIRRENARWFKRQPDHALNVDLAAGMDEALRTSAADTDVMDMRRGIAALPDEYREPLVLQVLMGMTAEEIAKLMDISSGAVLTRLYRARKQLRDLLAARA